MADGPRDPWRVVADLVATDADRRAADPGLTAALDQERARFGAAAGDVADLLDELERRSVVDVDAPVESSRPVVPQLKLAVRKANAFVSRHLAQQVTVLTQTTAAALRGLHERVAALEAGRDVRDLQDRLLDHRPAVADRLADLASAGARRDVGAPDGLATLPEADAALVVLWGFVDVVTAADLRRALARGLAGVAPGGALAVVGTDPAAWATAADPIVLDLAPGHPCHGDTIAHLLRRAGAAEVDVVQVGAALLVVGRR